MLKTLMALGGKIALSLAAITLFLYVSAKLPFFRGDTPTLMTLASMDSGNAATARGSAAGSISFAGADDRFSGSFFGLEDNSGFQLAERDVPGECANAGRRYLEAQCPDCVVTAAQTNAGDPATLFFIQPDGQLGTIFRDCNARVSDLLVRVPQLLFMDDTLALPARDAGSAEQSPVPRLARAERVSSMTLGNWVIAVDDVTERSGALGAMARQLQSAGWREQSQGDAKASIDEQRVFIRGDARRRELCVLTLNEADDGYQLVTMMSI
jgi:hypothetical protein